MRISDLVVMCTRNLTRRKVRTFLTITGVTIGTYAVVIMLSLVLGISARNQATLEQMGDLTLIEIYNYGGAEVLDDAAMSQILAIPGVKTATPLMEYNPPRGMMMKAGRQGRYEWYAWNIIGMYPEAIPELGYEMAQGVMIEDADGKVIQVMFGERTAYDFYDAKKRWPNNYVDYWSDETNPPDPFFDPLEGELTLVLEAQKQDAKDSEYTIQVVGIMEGDYRRGYETMYGAIISIEDLQRIRTEYNKANGIKNEDSDEGYTSARVKCDNIDVVGEVEAQIQALGFNNTSSMEQEREAMQEQTRQLEQSLGLVGGVMLIISGVSIINTMYMSVYERTREIGVMKVLGCVLGNIRTLFLMEAALIGFIGGVIGNLLSYGTSHLLNLYGDSLGDMLGGSSNNYYYYGEQVMGNVSIIPPWLFLLGLGIATSVGLIAGILPALRATRISALEAIKQD